MKRKYRYNFKFCFKDNPLIGREKIFEFDEDPSFDELRKTYNEWVDKQFTHTFYAVDDNGNIRASGKSS